MASNMLSVKKLRLHGIKDVRWTVHDHKTQYKGLVKLFERDKKITDADLKMTIKKNKKEIKHLFKDALLKRQQLDNYLGRDRQTVNNLLAVDGSLKNAYKQLDVSEILDHLFQDNFTKRKTMDLLKHRLKIKIGHLTKLKLEESDLILQQTYSVYQKTSLEQQIGMVTGKVQDMILKKEATITVNATYKVLRHLLQKDAIYYNAVLDALSEDCLAQGHCLMEAINRGQLITEYLDDMKVEFETLQSRVKHDKKFRCGDMEYFDRKRNETIRSLQMLVRKDSDLNRGFPSDIQFDATYERCTVKLRDLVCNLKMLQSTFKVTKFDEIFPCLQEQRRQHERLSEFLSKGLKGYKTMTEKKRHAEVMLDTIVSNNFLRESTYSKKKDELNAEIANMKARYKDNIEKKVRAGSTLAKIRLSLQNIESMCKMVKYSENVAQESNFDLFKGSCNEMLKYILNKINYLSIRAFDDSFGQLNITPEVYSKFYESVEGNEINLGVTWRRARDDEMNLTEDSSVPTRADIKAASRSIYENYISSVII